MLQYFDKIIRGTDREDSLVINQFMKEMVGKRFQFLNYYKEIPVSYDAKLLNVENEMAEFEVHEYQAKVINIERKALVYRHESSAIQDDLFSEVFYVNVAKKRVILCKFGYAKIRSSMRRFVRVTLDRPVQADLVYEDDIIRGTLKDISLGGAALSLVSRDILIPGLELPVFLKLPDSLGSTVSEIEISASVIHVEGDSAPLTCIIEFHPDKNSQQQISYFINQRQVEIIKELKELKS
jgi:hypothetical protein